MTFVRFGLIVTGRGEKKFLPNLFRAIMAASHCTFDVIRKSEQLSPVTSQKRILKLAGKRIPTIDEDQFGIPALHYLRKYPNGYVIVIDDLEAPRRNIVRDVFTRYRLALDTVLAGDNLSVRASVHFLVNMLEAYYFAHPDAINGIAGREIVAQAPDDEVETIPHPKNQLKALWTGFDEVKHGNMIINSLDLEIVLARAFDCGFLRNLFAWCIDRLVNDGSVWDAELSTRFAIPTGCQAIATARQ